MNFLVAFDEFGRGIVIADGIVIACVVVLYFIDKCCCMFFSMYYYRFVDDYVCDFYVVLVYMACRVETSSGVGVETFGRETVIFLYIFVSGNCL